MGCTLAIMNYSGIRNCSYVCDLLRETKRIAPEIIGASLSEPHMISWTAFLSVHTHVTTNARSYLCETPLMHAYQAVCMEAFGIRERRPQQQTDHHSTTQQEEQLSTTKVYTSPKKCLPSPSSKRYWAFARHVAHIVVNYQLAYYRSRRVCCSSCQCDNNIYQRLEWFVDMCVAPNMDKCTLHNYVVTVHGKQLLYCLLGMASRWCRKIS